METIYDKFTEEMNKRGLKKVFSNLDERDVYLSDDDEVINVTIKNCQMITIRGIRESSIKGKLLVHPYYTSLKVFDYNNEEAKPEDAVQFGISELKRSGLPGEWSRIIYYHFPYKAASRLKLKKGVAITKNKNLEIKIMRNGSPIKIGKFEIKIECDKWYKNSI